MFSRLQSKSIIRFKYRSSNVLSACEGVNKNATGHYENLRVCRTSAQKSLLVLHRCSLIKIWEAVVIRKIRQHFARFNAFLRNIKM